MVMYASCHLGAGRFIAVVEAECDTNKRMLCPGALYGGLAWHAREDTKAKKACWAVRLGGRACRLSGVSSRAKKPI